MNIYIPILRFMVEALWKFETNEHCIVSHLINVLFLKLQLTTTHSYLSLLLMAVDYLGFKHFRCHNRTLNFIVTNNIIFFHLMNMRIVGFCLFCYVKLITSVICMSFQSQNLDQFVYNKKIVQSINYYAENIAYYSQKFKEYEILN